METMLRHSRSSPTCQTASDSCLLGASFHLRSTPTWLHHVVRNSNLMERTWQMKWHVERENKDHGGTRHVSEEVILEIDISVPVAPADIKCIRHGAPKQAPPEFLTHRIIRCNKMILSIKFGIFCYISIGNWNNLI